jgi:hypothetical protein
MKSFFKNMNLARAIMLFSLVGVLVLGVIGWQRHTRLSELRAHYEQDVDKVVRQVMQLGRRHTQLSAAMRKEELAGQSDLESYIRKYAAADRVEIGNVNIAMSTDPRTKGVVDKKYTIKPSDKDRSFSRTMVANFLYRLESESRRVKVTEIALELAEKRLKAHEIPADDKWTFEAELTSRQRVE